jgi:hypothetical protein
LSIARGEAILLDDQMIFEGPKELRRNRTAT